MEEIIEKIREFLSRVVENNNNKVFVYYGDYEINRQYQINDFMANSKISYNNFTILDFFRVNQIIYEKHYDTKAITEFTQKIKKIKERYLILTEVYFLLFSLNENDKSLVKLLFQGNIIKLNKCRNSVISQNNLTFKWKNENEKAKLEFNFVFEKNQIKLFLDTAKKKISFLEDKYKLYQEDLLKPVKDVNPENVKTWEIERILELIKFKEEILEKIKSMNIINELMTLYQMVKSTQLNN